MIGAAYYNEHDPKAAAWLRELIREGHIADGEVDERSIADVAADDVRGFVQCHFFAGIGGWSLALQMAHWPADVPVWTGSCPCQRFSSAARGRAVAPDMWPEFRRIIAASLPRTIFGEQVPHARDWFDGLCADMEALDYQVAAAVLPAVSVGADHARPRIYFVGHANRDGQPGMSLNAEVARMRGDRRGAGSLVPPYGVSRDMVALSGFGNAIVPQVAAIFIQAADEAMKTEVA